MRFSTLLLSCATVLLAGCATIRTAQASASHLHQAAGAAALRRVMVGIIDPFRQRQSLINGSNSVKRRA
jgi:uncharacterized lipoprotein YajG